MKLNEMKESLKKALEEVYDKHEKSTDKYMFLHDIEEFMKKLREKNKH